MAHNRRDYRVPLSSFRDTGSSVRGVPYQAPAGAAHRHVQGGGARQRDQCDICSNTQEYPGPQVPVYHRHFSSLRMRVFAGVEDGVSDYFCPSCKSHHKAYPRNRIK